MSREITLIQAKALVAKLTRGIDTGKVQLAGANSGKAVIKRRWGKNKGGGPLVLKTRKGKRLGSYSVGHAARRRKKGRQIAKVDLQMTDRLFNSFQVGNFRGEPVVGFVQKRRSDSGNTNGEIAAYIEEMYNAEPFSIDASEFKDVEKAIQKELERQIRSLW